MKPAQKPAATALLSFAVALVVALAAASGCSKSEPVQVATPPAPATDTTDTAAPAPEETSAAPGIVAVDVTPDAPGAAGGASDSAIEADAVQADRAIQAQNYEQAAAALIQAQMKGGGTGPQARANQYNRMRQLQLQLAKRIAANPNDPAAQKAAQMIQAAQSYQMQGGAAPQQ